MLVRLWIFVFVCIINLFKVFGWKHAFTDLHVSIISRESTVSPVKNEDFYPRICVVDDPACWFKESYWERVPAKSIFIHPVDYTTGWQACVFDTKAKNRPCGWIPGKKWLILYKCMFFTSIFSFFFYLKGSALMQNPNSVPGWLSERPLEGADTLAMRATVWMGAEDTLLSCPMCVKSWRWR